MDLTSLSSSLQALQAHFSQATTDIDNILTSNRKITGRGARIQALDFDGSGQSAGADAPLPPPPEPDDLPELPFRRLDGI